MFNEMGCSVYAVDELSGHHYDVEHLVQNVDGIVSELSRDELVDLIICLRDICCTQQHEIDKLAAYISDMSSYVDKLNTRVNELESFNINFLPASTGS